MTAELGDAFFEKYLAPTRTMVILRGFGPEPTVELCRRAWSLGIVLVEVPVQSEQDLAALAAAVSAGKGRDRLVGAGTVTSPGLTDEVADAGAAFTVAPGLDETVLETSWKRGLPHLPGVATGTEVHRALQLGCIWQKAFPASILGADWIPAMHGPFPQVHFVTTGGVGATNGADFLRAGAAAIALGSSFADMSEDDIRRLTSSDRVIAPD